MDLSKASDLTTQALSQLWTAYHQSKGFLSAAVPLETYLRMLNSARKYPLFVLPLARVAELPEGQEAESATEMHLLVRGVRARNHVRDCECRSASLTFWTTSYDRLDTRRNGPSCLNRPRPSQSLLHRPSCSPLWLNTKRAKSSLNRT